MRTQYLPFRGLAPDLPVRVHRRNLPHWRQDGATYFVTFRLADSVPRGKLMEWRWERQTWYEAYGLGDDLPPEEWRRRYAQIPRANRDQFERRMAKALLVELDQCHGACWLRRRDCSAAVARALQHFDLDRCQCGDFVVMPLDGHELEAVLASVKHYTAVKLNKVLAREGELWQRESYDRLVRDDDELARIREYIAGNHRHAHLRSGEYVYRRTEWLDMP